MNESKGRRSFGSGEEAKKAKRSGAEQREDEQPRQSTGCSMFLHFGAIHPYLATVLLLTNSNEKTILTHATTTKN